MATDGFRNRAAPLLIAGDPAGAHVEIDAAGIRVYDTAGALVSSLTPAAGLTVQAMGASVLIGSATAGHILIDNTGIFQFNSAGDLVGKWVVPASQGILSADFVYASHLILPATADIPGGSATGRVQVDPGVGGDTVHLFGPVEGIQFLKINGTGQPIPMQNGSLEMFSGQRGSVTVTCTSGQPAATGTVTFTNSFLFAPIVVLSVTPFTGNTAMVAMVNTVSTTTFTYRVMFAAVPTTNFSSTANVTLYWLAV